MKSKTLILYWFLTALAVIITYLFCKITCAPIRANMLAFGPGMLITAAFVIAVLREWFIHRQKRVI